MAASVLYTPQVLGMAVELAAVPFQEDLPLVATARSATCGSQLRLGLECDDAGRIARLGVAAQACAIGQAAAAVFARGAIGADLATFERGETALRRWLAGEGPMPDWDGLDALSVVPDYPGRHGAVLLAWQAAREALSTAHEER